MPRLLFLRFPLCTVGFAYTGANFVAGSPHDQPREGTFCPYACPAQACTHVLNEKLDLNVLRRVLRFQPASTMPQNPLPANVAAWTVWRTLSGWRGFPSERTCWS